MLRSRIDCKRISSVAPNPFLNFRFFMACLSFTAILTSVVVAVLETAGIIMCCRFSDEIGTSLLRRPKSLIENIKKLGDMMAEIKGMRPSEEINNWVSEVEEILEEARLVLLPESKSSSDIDDQQSCCCLGYHERVPCELQREVKNLIVKGEGIVAAKPKTADRTPSTPCLEEEGATPLQQPVERPCNIPDIERGTTTTVEEALELCTEEGSTVDESLAQRTTAGVSVIEEDLIGGAALRAAFKEFFLAIEDAIEPVSMSRPSLFITLEGTCKAIKPFISDIERFNKILNFPPKELKRIHDLMKEGSKLVTNCSKLHSREIYLKNYYAKELVKLDREMKRFFLINVVAILARNVMGPSVDMEKIRDAMRILTGGQGVFTGGEAVKTRIGGGYYVKNDGPEAPSFVVGVDKQYQEVKSRLLQKGVSVIVVSGLGGCGKTTLVKKVCNDPEIKGKFKNHAYFSTATQSFNAVFTIQEMCRYNGLDASNIQTESDAFNALKQVLAKVGEHPILLVLDDVWSESKSLLEKFVIRDIQDYKIMVTSRFEFPSFGSPIRLEPLEHHYAKAILLNAATTLTGDLFLPDDDVVDEIVKKCKGLPLALKVVGNSLSGRDPSAWKSRLRTWNDGDSILDSDSEILNCLNKSLVDLSNQSAIKDCFLELGSFPEHHMIPACALIDMWAELHNLDDDGVHAMYILHELYTRSLVDLVLSRSEGFDDSDYEDQSVMQHDLLRQLAIHQSSQEPIKQRKKLMLHIRRNTFPPWWKEQTEQPVNANLLSVSTDELFSATWPDMAVHAVEVFVLNFRTQKYTLPKFMEGMTRLKALIVANNSFFPAILTNIALLASLSNLKRVRLERIRIPFLQMENVQLKNLQKISLFMCDISKEVLDSEIQIHDAIPNLLEISIAYCKNLKKLPAHLCDVTSLRKISITNCPDLSVLPQQIGSLSNLEMLRLNACTNLQGLPDTIGSLQNLMFLDISDCIEIEDLPDQIGQLSNLKEFHMKGWLKLYGLPSSIRKLQNLRKVTCHESKASLWNPFEIYLSNLKVEVVKEDISLNWLQNSR